jgi:DNA repair exonuclease SbcCD ATPase subunit
MKSPDVHSSPIAPVNNVGVVKDAINEAVDKLTKLIQAQQEQQTQQDTRYREIESRCQDLERRYRQIETRCQQLEARIDELEHPRPPPRRRLFDD